MRKGSNNNTSSGGGGVILSRKSKNAEQQKRNRSYLNAFFVTLIFLAIGLSALAIHLTSQIGWTTQHPINAKHDDIIHNNNNNNNKNNMNGIAKMKRYGGAHKKSSVQRKVGEEQIKAALNNRNDFEAALKNAAAVESSAVDGEKSQQQQTQPQQSELQTQKQQQQLPYPNGPKTDPQYSHHRVYCMVPFIWNKLSYDIIMSTWGRRCNTINFLTDSMVISGKGSIQGDIISEDKNEVDGKVYKHHSEFPDGTFPDNVIFINMTRPWTGCTDGKTKKPKICRHIWEKMWRSWIYVGENHLNEAEWFCKVDYDTFFFPENLQYYVHDYKHWDPYNEHHYFGGVLSHRVSMGRPELAAGAAACWSHKTMAGITEVYKNMPKGYQGGDRGRCEDRPQASEEISTSMCLKKGLNVTVEAMRDDELREYVMVDPYHNHLTWNRTEQGEWWFWKGKPENVGQMDDCCAIRPMAIHKYKRHEQIKALDEQFYGPNDNDELKKLNERTRRYADKVRRAMGLDQQQ